MVKNKIYLYSILSGFGFLILDWLFHYFDTQPQETVFYFLLGFIGTSIVSYIVIKYYKLSFKSIFTGSLAWLIVFTTYYRIYELLYYEKLAQRTPDILFPMINHSNLFLLALGWGIVHFSAIFIPLLIVKVFKKK